MDEKKYRISFIRMFLLLNLVWWIPTIIVLIGSPSWVNFIAMFLSGLIIMTIVTAIIFIMSPIKINENGFIIKNQQSRTFYTEWKVIKWDDIYAVKPISLLCFEYLQLFCKGRVKPLWIPLSVRNDSMFIEDLIKYVPDENPLKDYITTGEIVDVTKLSQIDDLANSQVSEKYISDIYAYEVFRAKQAIRIGANWFYWIAGLSLINTIVLVAGINREFVAGLVILQNVNILALIITAGKPEIGIVLLLVALVFNVFAVGIFIVFGYFANKRHQWSFILGMIVYALDMLMAIASLAYFSVVIHAVALIAIYSGLKANRKLDEIEKKSMNIVP